MKYLVRNALVTVLGIGLVGCEWSGGGSGGGSWNSRYNFVNFSGSYRGANGFLVSSFTTSSGGTTVKTSGGFIPPVQVVNGNFSGNSISFTTDFVPIKPGSLTVAFADGTKGSVTDNGSGGISGSYLNAIPGNHPANGTVVYENGQVSIFFPDALGLQNAKISVKYTVDAGSSTTTTTGGNTPGGSVEIVTFNVQQEGNKLRMIDNNGSVYEGNFGSIRSSSGVDQDTANPSFNNGDQIIGQFEASGTSAAGVNVKMVGSFQTVVSGVQSSGTTTSMTLGDRRITGTWIEDGGKTGDINGIADSVSASTTTTSSGTSTNSP